MKLKSRTAPAPVLPGVRGPARLARRIHTVLARLRPGDVLVLDHHDLDSRTARAIVDAGVVAVLNASPMLSGRYPALGPQVLMDAGLRVVDRLGPELLVRATDGTALRVDGAEVYGEEELLVTGRVVAPDQLADEMASARDGLVAQLESFTHNTTEFLRREQDLLLHGRGVPPLNARVEGRPVVVVVDGRDVDEELKAIGRFIAEQHPVLVGVDGGVGALTQAGHQPDVVVLDASLAEEDLPRVRTLRKARDVVLRCNRGSTTGHERLERLERLGLRPVRFASGATAEDAALVLTSTRGASIIVGAGLQATLDDFLDRQRPGLASTYLIRLTVGEKLVDARSVPTLYSGRVRPWHLFVVLLTGLLALAAAVAVTPVGRDAVDALQPHLTDLLDRLRGLPDLARGLL